VDGAAAARLSWTTNVILSRRPDIERFIAGPGVGVRAAIIHGRDLGLVRERATSLAGAVTAKPDDPFDAAHLTESEVLADPARLEGELSAISMMGGRRLVRLRLSGSTADRAAADALERHLSGALNPEAFFLIESDALRNDSPLIKGGKDHEACGIIPCYEDDPGDLARLTREALAGEGISLDARALEAFGARLPHDRGVARQEIERLTLFIGPGARGAARLEDLTDFFGVEPDVSLAEAALHAFGGRLGAAQADLRRAHLEGESGIPAIRALAGHLARLRRATQLRAGGTSPQVAAKSVGIFWKSEREFIRQSTAWTQAELTAPQRDILAADLACRRTGAPDRLLAERLAFAIASQARRLGL
jgi:DNA polymerase-3 subunit delta